MPTIEKYTPPPPCPCRECVRHRLTFGTRKFDKNGYCPDGFDRDCYDQGGYDVDGYNRAGYNADGYNADGYNADGWNEDGYNAEGYDAAGYDAEGYNADGYDDAGYNTAGYNAAGYNAAGYDVGGYDDEGYDSDGYDDDGEDRNGNFREDIEDEEPPIDDGSCCHSPQMKFSVRNDGDNPLANDTRTTVTLPEGTISAEGIDAIRVYLQRCYDPDRRQYIYADLSYELGALGDQWQTGKGNYAKRLSRLAYEKRKLKLSPEIMSQVGVIAREHSASVNVTIDVTRDLNQEPRCFYHSDSCWWQSYSESRCALKTNGGFGLRSYSDRDSYSGRYVPGSSQFVSGRAWVMPLRATGLGQLTPTFDTRTPDAFMVFNGYGELAGYAAARILAHMAGWTYRRTGFDCSPMYVNSGGYLVTREEIAKQYTDKSLNLSVDQHSSLFENERAERNAKKELAEHVGS